MVIKQLTKHTKPAIQPIDSNWTSNADVKNLLDVICSILAEEYIEVAKQNKGIFEIASVASLSRNDEREDISHNDINQNGDSR